MWSGVNVDFKVSDQIKLESRNQYRLKTVWDEWDQAFSQISAKYKFKDKFGIRGFYRFAVENNDPNKHRIGGDFTFSSKLGKKSDFSLSYRFRFQNTMKQGEVTENKSIIRNKIGIVYKLDKLAKPYVSTEYFSATSDDDENSLRFTFGLQTRISDMLRLASFYRYEKEEGEDSENIIGMMLTIKLAKEMFSESEPIDD